MVLATLATPATEIVAQAVAVTTDRASPAPPTADKAPAPALSNSATDPARSTPTADVQPGPKPRPTRPAALGEQRVALGSSPATAESAPTPAPPSPVAAPPTPDAEPVATAASNDSDDTAVTNRVERRPARSRAGTPIGSQAITGANMPLAPAAPAPPSQVVPTAVPGGPGPATGLAGPAIVSSHAPKDTSQGATEIIAAGLAPTEAVPPTATDRAAAAFVPLASPAPPSAPDLRALPPANGSAAVPAPESAPVTVDARRIGHEVGLAIGHRLDLGGTELVIKLSPRELGTVEVRMRFAEQHVHAVITADNAQATELLRRDVDQLARSLSSTGFTADSANLTFATGDNTGAGNRDRGGAAPRDPGATPYPLAASDIPAAALNPVQTGRFATGRINVLA